jgi:hypothetical protein
MSLSFAMISSFEITVGGHETWLSEIRWTPSQTDKRVNEKHHKSRRGKFLNWRSEVSQLRREIWKIARKFDCEFGPEIAGWMNGSSIVERSTKCSRAVLVVMEVMGGRFWRITRVLFVLWSGERDGEFVDCGSNGRKVGRVELGRLKRKQSYRWGIWKRKERGDVDFGSESYASGGKWRGMDRGKEDRRARDRM